MEMAEKEHQHRRWLTDLYAKKFGDYIPLIRRSDIQGFVRHKPAWTIGKMNIEEMRQRAEVIELENYRFYKQAAERSQDPQVKKLLLDLAEAEKGHESIAVKRGTTHLAADAKIEEGAAKRRLAGHRGGFRRALGDLVDPLQVHGYAFPQGGLPNCCRRLSGVPHGYADRQCLRAQASLISTAPTTIRAAPARRGRLTFSFRTRIESSITMRIEVSRSAATLAMGALVMAQMAIQ